MNANVKPMEERQKLWAGVRDRFSDRTETPDDRMDSVNAVRSAGNGDDPCDAFDLRAKRGEHRFRLQHTTGYRAEPINQPTLADRLRSLRALADRMDKRAESMEDRDWWVAVLTGISDHGVDPRDALDVRRARGSKTSAAACDDMTHDARMFAIGWMRSAMVEASKGGHGYTYEKAAEEAAKHFSLTEETIKTYCSRFTRQYPRLRDGVFVLRRRFDPNE